MLIDVIMGKGMYCDNWITEDEKNKIKEINQKVFMETLIGRMLILINYFFIRELVYNTGGEFLPNFETEANKYIVLLSWIVLGIIIAISVFQLILKSKVYNSDVNLNKEEKKLYKYKLINRSIKILWTSAFYITLYQIFFQLNMTGINIKSTILWWIIIFNMLILIHISLLVAKNHINMKTLSYTLEEVTGFIEARDFKSGYNKVEEVIKRDFLINGKEFDITYRAIKDLISIAEKTGDNEVISSISKSELITNVSHDLKTPLTSIINYVDFLKRGNLDKKDIKTYIDVLDRKSERLKILIEDLKEYTDATEGSIKINYSSINLLELLNQVLLEANEKIEKSTLKFQINLVVNDNKQELKSENIKLIQVDYNKTFRVFQNIISNIIKYSLKDSTVYINIEQKNMELESEESFSKVIFINTSSERINLKADVLMERFRRGDTSRNTEGTGLGLDIARKLVEVQGGDFNIEVKENMFKVKIKFIS